ncbi:dihydroxyacetone phosphate acyltransferase [Lethenteron reissneri]|uniref:dihydroxyacetone phosphate acyltransferase n=1 Tax=Lethenteron reissneri TaxID=7753 RepID=UPI002AB63E54|nr:dihydroxyacetone phosphate acyltransferase [Lethenteron reissneri]
MMLRADKRDDMEDVLEERRASSDVRFSLRRYAPPSYRYHSLRSPAALKSAVLHSERLQDFIRQEAQESGEPVEVITERASDILEEMGHNQRMCIIRTFALTLSKTFKALFRSVRLNEEGLQRIQKAVQEYPVVLLPSHRSYIDFLMLSYIFYTYDLPLPVIAAGMDFQGMKIVGEMLRMAGAFFMRRSFGNNALYWLVFSEYVQAVLRNGDAPVEFFLEGTRSRTNKSLPPKLGLLNMALEPMLRGEVYDTYAVAVSISYDRLLEEALYARELLGVPKPKESTSGLLKARSVLREDYGSVHLYFHAPVSLKALANGRIDSKSYNLTPRHLSLRPPESTLVFARDIAHHMVRTQQHGMVASPWALIASILMQHHGEIEFSLLLAEVQWLRCLIEKFGAFLHWPEGQPLEAVVRDSVRLHGNIASTLRRGGDGDDGGDARAGSEIVRLAWPCQAPPRDGDAALARACVELMCSAYRNHVLHLLVRPAFVVMACHAAPGGRKDIVYSHFCFLLKLFEDDFIFVPNNEIKDMEEGVALLLRCAALVDSAGSLALADTDAGARVARFLRDAFRPFHVAYQVVCRYLLTLESGSVHAEGRLLADLQNHTMQLILTGELLEYEALSSNLQRNILSALVRLKALSRTRGKEGVRYNITEQMERVAKSIATLQPTHSQFQPRL